MGEGRWRQDRCQGVNNLGSEGASEVVAKGLTGQKTRNSCVVRITKLVVWMEVQDVLVTRN